VGVFFLPPELQAGEVVVWAKAANRSQGGRAVGGRLHLTSHRLVFAPNRVDALTGGHAWAARLADVVAVGSAENSLRKPFSGAMRRRLRVDLRTGPPEFFVVNQVDEVIQRLRSSGLGGSGSE
jgi:hypothetical protein